MVRPHRLRVSIANADATELERLWMPTLRHGRGLLARAFSLGRTPVPEWLAERRADATVQIGVLKLGDSEARDIQSHLVWDGTKVELDNLRGRLGGGLVAGALSVNLRGSVPNYRLEVHCKDMEWKSGTVDTDTALES